MSGRLKQRGMDRDTLDTQRALSGLDTGLKSASSSIRSALTTIDSIRSFNYEVVEVARVGGLPADPVGVNVTGTEAVVSATDDNDFTWNITGGVLTVTGLGGDSSVRFLVF